MKKLILPILLLSLLTACHQPANQTPAENIPHTETTGPVTYDDSLIEVISKSGSGYSGSKEGEILYQYDLPQLISKGQEAEKINNQISSYLPADGNDILYREISWESHWNHGILSLILKLQSADGETDTYQVYNYDFITDKQLSNQALALSMGMSEETLSELLYQNTAACFDRIFCRESPDFTSELWDLRALTLSRSNLDFNMVPIYLEDDGSFSAIVSLAVPSGSGIQQTAVQLHKTELPVLEATDGYVTAKMEDGKITVQYRQSPNAPWSMSESYVPHDREIPVDHLTGNYVDMAMGNMSPEFWPVLLLLDENGQVSYCDLGEYDSVTESLHGIGPIPCTAPIQYFSEMETQWSIVSPCGVDINGGKIDLYRLLYDASFTFSPNLYATDWTSDDGSFTMKLSHGIDEHKLIWSDKSGEIATGMVWFRGMDSQGLYYHYILFAGPDTVYGTIILHFPSFNSGDLPYLTIQNHSAVPLPGLGAESECSLFFKNP